MLRPDFVEGMKADMYEYYFEGESYSDYKPVWPLIYKEQKSNRAYEKGTSVIGVGELEEVEPGAVAPIENVREGWTTLGKNRTFKKAVIITKEALDDHQKVENMLKATAKEWGNKWPETKDTMAAKPFLFGGLTAGHDIFNNAISGGVLSDPSGLLMYDSIELFNLSGNTRTSKGGGTYYNAAALALSVPNIKTQWTLMTVTNAKNERDEVITIIPDSLIIGSGALEWTGRTILESTLVPGSGNNDKNLLQGIVDLIVWRKITDTDAWILSKVKHGKVFQNRMEPEIKFFEDKKTSNWEANIMTRAGVRFDNFRFDVASNLPSS